MKFVNFLKLKLKREFCSESLQLSWFDHGLTERHDVHSLAADQTAMKCAYQFANSDINLLTVIESQTETTDFDES